MDFFRHSVNLVLCTLFSIVGVTCHTRTLWFFFVSPQFEGYRGLRNWIGECVFRLCICCTKERSRQIKAKRVFFLIIKNLIIFEFFCRVSFYLVVNIGFNSLSFGDVAVGMLHFSVDMQMQTITVLLNPFLGVLDVNSITEKDVSF